MGSILIPKKETSGVSVIVTRKPPRGGGWYWIYWEAITSILSPGRHYETSWVPHRPHLQKASLGTCKSFSCRQLPARDSLGVSFTGHPDYQPSVAGVGKVNTPEPGGENLLPPRSLTCPLLTKINIVPAARGEMFQYGSKQWRVDLELRGNELITSTFSLLVGAGIRFERSGIKEK